MRMSKSAIGLLGALCCAVLSLASPAGAAGRVALVIGNQAYENLTPLANPGRDAGRLAELLAANGFEVMSCDGERAGCFDLDRSAMTDAIEDFGFAARDAEVALFFYAGHGMQTGDGNVIAPVNMELACDMLAARRGTMLDDVLNEMAGAREKIVILDACRNDPLKAQRCATRGARPLSFGSFAVPDSVSRFLLLSSTQNGQVAQDGLPGGHSPFAESLIQWMEQAPQARFGELFDRVSKQVIEKTAAANFTQVPEMLIRGGAPEACLGGGDCAASAEAIALRAEVEALEAQNARNQDYEEIVVALLRNAGYDDPQTLSDGERRRVFAEIMAASRALAERGAEGEAALAALREGDDSGAEAIFRRDLADGPVANPEAGSPQPAASLLHLAAIARLTDTGRAVELYEQAVAIDPDNLETLIALAETSLAAGQREQARQAYERAAVLVEQDRGTAEQQVWATEGLADMEWADGRSLSALELYVKANAAARRGSAQEPGNTGLRRGILVTRYNIGHLKMDSGDIDGALEAFRDGLAVAEALAAEHPFDPRWAFDVGRGHERIGRALQRRGDLDAALAEYQKKHAVMTRVATAFPDHPVWQRDLALADEFLGDVATAKGDHAGAARHYRASLQRMIPVRDANPGHAGHQRFTAVTHLALGDALFETGAVAEAVENYRAGMAVSLKLAAADPGNAQWRWDLFRAYQRLASSQPPGTEWHAKALETIERLEADGLLAEHNRRWIGITRQRLEEAREVEGGSR